MILVLMFVNCDYCFCSYLILSLLFFFISLLKFLLVIASGMCFTGWSYLPASFCLLTISRQADSYPFIFVVSMNEFYCFKEFYFLVYLPFSLDNVFQLYSNFQIKPLVDPTKVIVELNGLQYSWHDLVSKG